MSKVLIIEDEKAIADIIAFNLKKEGFETAEAYDGESGLAAALDGDADLILLDVMLPLMDGFEVLRRLRARSGVPVIMVTAREEEQDKIFGLDSGADDYITKPFSMKELIARVRANIRRRAENPAPAARSVPAFGPFSLDDDLKQLLKNGKPLELSQREYDIVAYFLSIPQRVVSREELMKNVWGYDYYGDLRAVDVAMRRLREKLEDDPANPKHIMTKRGSGYYLQK
jgi:two-component system response regulator VicR